MDCSLVPWMQEHNGAIDLATEAVIEWSLQNRKEGDDDGLASTVPSNNIFEEMSPGWSAGSDDSQRANSEEPAATGDYF